MCLLMNAWVSFDECFVLFKQTVGFSGIQAEIIGIQGEHADHLTTTTAQFDPSLCL